MMLEIESDSKVKVDEKQKKKKVRIKNLNRQTTGTEHTVKLYWEANKQK